MNRILSLNILAVAITILTYSNVIIVVSCTVIIQTAKIFKKITSINVCYFQLV